MKTVQDETIQDVIDKYSKGRSKAGGLTCDQLLRRAAEKEARAEKLARTNAPKAAAAEAAAKREYEKDLQRAAEEAKRAAHAAGVAYACATKPAKRRGPIAAAAAPRKAASKKTPKRGAKEFKYRINATVARMLSDDPDSIIGHTATVRSDGVFVDGELVASGITSAAIRKALKSGSKSPYNTSKKTPKRAAKKAPKKSSKRGAAKKTAKRGGKKTTKKVGKKAGKRGMAKMDRKLLNAARRAVKGQGDGRISLADAHKMMRSIIDNKDDRNDYTDKEKATMEHIRQNFSFTPEADEWMRHQIASHGARQAHRAMGHTVKAPKAPKAKRASKKAGKKASAKKVPKAKRAAKAAAPKKQAKKVGARGGRRKAGTGPVIFAEGPVIVDNNAVNPDMDAAISNSLGDVVAKAMRNAAANEGLPRRGRKSSKPKKASRRQRDVIEGCPSPSRGGHIPSGY